MVENPILDIQEQECVGEFKVCFVFLQMRLIILDTSSDVSEWAAKYVRRKILDFNPGPDKYFTLGLPTGMIIIMIKTLFY